LGRQAQARARKSHPTFIHVGTHPRLKRRTCSFDVATQGATRAAHQAPSKDESRAARLQSPMSTLSPAMGVTCGPREREAGTEHWRSNPHHGSALATVEGILVHATSSTFAGRRKNVSLGRSEASVAGLVPMQAVAPMTAGVLWKKEEGNVVSMREAHALDASMPKKHRHVLEDTSFTRSRDPCTRTACSARVSRKRQRVAGSSGWATIRRCRGSQVSRSGKPAQAGGTGTGAMIDRRCAARRASPFCG
jgi:hypothetical protein